MDDAQITPAGVIYWRSRADLLCAELILLAGSVQERAGDSVWQHDVLDLAQRAGKALHVCPSAEDCRAIFREEASKEEAENLKDALRKCAVQFVKCETGGWPYVEGSAMWDDISAIKKVIHSALGHPLPCPSCHGAGTSGDSHCPACDGTGEDRQPPEKPDGDPPAT